ncbi:MAG: HD domain-containing protein [Mogibacterium sp.]|nr:HD domain-containing protein [Mogibacterium sp.]
MTLYTGTIILTELLMAAMSLHVLTYKGFTAQQKRWFIVTYVTIMLCAYTEFLAIHFNEHGSAFVRPLTIATVIQFSLTPMLPVFFTGALGMHDIAKKVSLFFAINVIIQIIAAPFGRIFYFDENGKYFHSDYYFIYEAFYIFSMAFLIVSLYIVGKRFKKRDSWTIFMILVVMVAAVTPQIIYHVYTDFIGIGISACLCYIYYNDLIQHDIQAELTENQAKITNIQEHIISELANLIERRDIETGEHVARTRAYVKILSEAAKAEGVYVDVISDNFIKNMGEFAPMHDIGKIVVSDRILRKPGPLTKEEFGEMKLHTTAGGRITREILEGITDEEHIRFAQDIAMYHHERWDGTGYPEGLRGEDIPLPARIMALADVYDALTSERCYKKAMKPDEAFEVIRSESGTHFDPKLTEVLLKHREGFESHGKE